MQKIKIGDVVGRKSYDKDVLFHVKKIVQTNQGKVAILRGVNERVEADSKIEDLELIEDDRIKESIEHMNRKIEERIGQKQDLGYHIGILTTNNRARERIMTGKILHLDGDKKYSQKSYQYYQKLGLNAIVKNIPEYKQPKVVYHLLEIYQPDILIVTGHDGMLKRGTGYNDIYNYRNSRYFINTVKEARRYDMENQRNLVIFAGACQSYFEALINAGANFASSPARILIDFLDPLVIAERIAITDDYRYVTIDDIAHELRDGKKGVSGIGANGKMKRIYN